MIEDNKNEIKSNYIYIYANISALIIEISQQISAISAWFVTELW